MKIENSIASDYKTFGSYNWFFSPSLIKKRVSKKAGSQGLPNLTVHFLGRRITFMTVAAIIESIHNACKCDRKITVANYNVNSFNLSMQLPWYYEFLQSSEITHCDGMGIIKALSYMGVEIPIQYRASYSLLMPELLEHCDRHQLSVFLLGAKPKNLEAAVERLQEQYPNATFKGHHGYFNLDDEAENQAIVQQINQIKPNVLIVGMGMPLQEKWVSRYRHCLQTNSILVGGAVIDRLAGIVTDCPKFISEVGLEWLYRLLKEPKRLAARYLLGNPAFLFHVALSNFYRSLGGTDTLRVEQEGLSSLGTPLNSHPVPDIESLPIPRQLRLGEYLVEAGLLSCTHLEEALAEQCVTGVRLGEILASKQLIKQETIEFVVKHVTAAKAVSPLVMSSYTKLRSKP